MEVVHGDKVEVVAAVGGCAIGDAVGVFCW